MRRVAPLLLLVVLLAAGCSSSSGSPKIKIGAARRFQLVDVLPSRTVTPGRSTIVAFTIDTPSSRPLLAYRTGAGPHTGVHLIIVSDDLSTIIHRHPRMRPDGRFAQRVVFPRPGRYRLITDAYTTLKTVPNFQLFTGVVVKGPRKRQELGGYRRNVVVDGIRVLAPPRPAIRAGLPAFLKFRVTELSGRPARLAPWYGALAHAIFFRTGTLDYVHTHVCAPGVSGCTSIVGGSRVTGRSGRPGELTVGVLLPTAGTWKLFLQARPNGRVITVPYVLKVR
jgi:hypothetical protein